jgi:hypothetical protein
MSPRLPEKVVIVALAASVAASAPRKIGHTKNAQHNTIAPITPKKYPRFKLSPLFCLQIESMSFRFDGTGRSRPVPSLLRIRSTERDIQLIGADLDDGIIFLRLRPSAIRRHEISTLSAIKFHDGPAHVLELEKNMSSPT